MSHEALEHRVLRASAGSGKTHQLTNRYLRLLARGAEPDTILATTFTRKAAGEILERVLERLAKAAGNAQEARELVKQLQAEAGTDFIAILRRMVRSLHRVRIGTLDSFYMTVAGSFSQELGLPAGWSICEESEDAELREEALEAVLEGTDADILIKLYERLTQGQTKSSVHGALREIVNELYEAHQQTEPAVWKKLVVPPILPDAQLEELLARIEGFDLSKYPKMPKARTDDVERVRNKKWPGLLKAGLCAKVLSGENSFNGKAIPAELLGLYGTLLQHARGVLVKPLAEQTAATREFLDHFDRELRTLKRADGGMRFDEVTQALVDAWHLEEVPTAALSFRLGGTIEHLLLDEFQDTSLMQWRVLRPIARTVTLAAAEKARSFFCVGDVKQAIYAWRGGMAGIFDTLEESLGPLTLDELFVSRRSAQPIIDAVNQVFGNLGQFQPHKCQDGLSAWATRFKKHSTVKKEIPGYVCLCTGPAQDGQDLAKHRGGHCAYVARKIQEIHKQAPGRSIGVLCRKNEGVARMMYELRLLQVDTSEEGGNALTDSPAVMLILSLFTLADHPGHKIAWFHLQNSPLKEELKSFTDADAFSNYLRVDLLANGYGPFVRKWELILIPSCDRRDRGRLQQLVHMAYGFQERSSLRADDFVAWVRQQRVPDPSAAKVRVMTIHGAKGLEFDVVVLPELDAALMGQTPAFVVGRDPKSLDVTFVCRYADENLQKLLTPEEQAAFEQDRQQGVEESLSLLYVAMTRAIHALYMYMPGPRKPNRKDAWYNLLVQTLAPEKPWAENALLYEHGDGQWFAHDRPESAPPAATCPKAEPITFRAAATGRRRGLEHMAPSRREGQASVLLHRLFHPSEGTGKAAGTLYHAWFALIGWLDEGVPSPDELRAEAAKIRADLPAETWRDLDRLMDGFRAYVQHADVRAVLHSSAYASPSQPGFPKTLASMWTRSLAPRQVERERRFVVADGKQFWTGSFDRIVWLGDGERTLAADVIDFKTDAIPLSALGERTEHYRPQLEAYRNAVGRLAQLPPECIATRLVFTAVGKIVDV